MPLFSIIVPTFNRAAVICRALDSALGQGFADFEIIVVDSASTDGTLEIVRDYVQRDPRVRLVCEESRRGVCPARNTAIANATGTWIVPLDSDDELPSGALALFRDAIAEAPEIDHHRFMCRWDDGSLSPRPPLVHEDWDYEGYLRFIDRCAAGGSTETMSCIRASTFRVLRFPEDRSYETLYHIDFASRFRTRAHTSVARLYHTDAADQNSFTPNPRHWLQVAPDHARSLQTLIARHGEAFQRWAPKAYAELLRSAAKFAFLAGDRRGGLSLLIRLWRRELLSPISWGVFVLGMSGRHVLAWADATRIRLSLHSK